MINTDFNLHILYAHFMGPDTLWHMVWQKNTDIISRPDDTYNFRYVS